MKTLQQNGYCFAHQKNYLMKQMLLCETVHSDRDQNKKSLHMFPQACIPVLRYTRWWNICGKGDHDSKETGWQ